VLRYALVTLGVVLIGACLFWKSLLGGLLDWVFGDSPAYQNYQRLQVGMTVAEVEAILGPGTPVKQADVPQMVVPVNPADAEASRDRARRAGVVPTARDYPTRNKPVVEGDSILIWEDANKQWRILVGFREGKVCEKDFWELSL
jgi:hypothetical protein